MKLYVTRNFSAAHHLPNYDGACHNLHGHTWKVEVWILGEVNQDTGMLIDFKLIKNVIDQLDHSNLNDIIDNPTAENLTLWIFNQLDEPPEINWVCVRLWESENSYAELSG